MKFEKGKRTYVAVECDRCGRKEACKTLPRALLLSQIQIQVQIHTHTHTHRNTIMSNIVQEGLKRLAIAACLPALTNGKTITNTRTHTYTMTTDMVVKTKEA